MNVRVQCLLVALAAASVPAHAGGRVVNILVAKKGTPAFETATSKADDKLTFAAPSLSKALGQVETLISEKKKCPKARHIKLKPPPCTLPEEERYLTINVKVAHGDYAGKGGGSVGLTLEAEPDTTLRLLGGYDDAFARRAPFDTPTTISAGGTAINIDGKDHALKELYISGFVLDVAPGNRYDAKTNSLLKGESPQVPIITVGYLTTERLVIADNIFLNASQKAMAPLIRARSDDAEVIVRNNFVLNSVLAWGADSARFSFYPGQYVLEGNSFISNWPYNPDPTTGSPGTLTLAGKYATHKFIIKENLFAHNIGGAIHSTSPTDKDPPPVEIKDNLFFGNGSLFSETAPGAAAVINKATFKSNDIPWNVISVDSLEEDYAWKSSGNVVMDPKVPVSLASPLFANSNAVQAENTTANTVRGMLGQNKQGGAVAIKDFAPRMTLDLKKLPFPAEPKAQKFGVRRDRVEQF